MADIKAALESLGAKKYFAQAVAYKVCKDNPQAQFDALFRAAVQQATR
jgi:hypothetical protein